MLRFEQLNAINPLAPPVGRQPGFDPTHIACSGATAVASCVVGSQGIFLDLTQDGARPSTINGTWTQKVDGNIGPASNQAAANGAARQAFQTVGQTLITDFAQTYAGIFRYTGLSTGSASIAGYGNLSGANGNTLALNWTTGGTMQFVSSSTSPALTLAYTVGVPYFAVASFITNVPSNPCNLFLLNLNNGSVTTASSAAGVGSFGSSNGTFIVGNGFSNLSSFVGNIAAAAYIPTFLSLQQMAVWAQDPFSFWWPAPAYPRRTPLGAKARAVAFQPVPFFQDSSMPRDLRAVAY
jgi:hypothetical protein